MMKFYFFRFLLLPLMLLSLYSYATPTTLHETSPLVSNASPEAFACNLPAPSGFVTTNVTTTNLSIAWSPVSGAISYQATAITDLGVTLFNGTVGTPALSVTTAPGTTVNFTVKAICADGEPSPNLGKYSDRTLFVIIEDLIATRKGNVPIDFYCWTPFNLPDNIDGALEFSVSNPTYGGEAGFFKLYYDVNDATAMLRYYTQGDFPSTLVYKDDNGMPPAVGAAVPTKDVFVSKTVNPNNIVKISITPVPLYPTTQIVNICVTTLQQSGYVVKQLIRASGRDGDSRSNDNNEMNVSEPLLAPNPFNDAFTLTLPETLPQAATLRLFDLNGKEVITETVEAGTLSKTIQTTDLTNGMYFAQLQSVTGIQVFKIIKTE